MPWRYALCPSGEQKTFDECLACENECFDLEIREALFEREVNHQAKEHTGNHISATALTGCLRGLYLERTTDYAATPKSQWWSLRGELIHKLVERPDMDNPYTRRSEARLYTEIDGITLSGQLDNWRQRFLEKGVLKDWKSIGDNGLRIIVLEGAKEEHVEQVNIYNLLAMDNGWEAKEIVITYFSLMDVVKTGHVATLAEFLKNPPAKSGKRQRMVGSPVCVKEYASGKCKWEAKYMIPSVPIWSREKTLGIIRPKLKILHNAFEHGIMPPKCSADMQEWKCDGYCNVAGRCADIEAQQAA